MRSAVVMVYPLLGMSGAFVRHAPIGLLYAASKLVLRGVSVKVFDARLYPDTWKEELAKLINDETLAVGISVMTGKPIESAIETGAFVKALDPDVKVIWGGPFGTFHPEFILRDDPNCDYVVSGYGSVPMNELIACLEEGRLPHDVQGVFYRDGIETVHTPANWSCHEFIAYQEIPYHLIEDYGVYGQLGQDRKYFSIYSAMGCAYNCAFCSSPALYNKIEGKRWVPFDPKDVADHIEFVIDKYDADYIYFIDDDSFVSLKHVENVIDEIQRRGLNVKLGFRGARINEIMKMSDAFIEKLISAGTDILHVGAESGSNRVLNLVRKNCTAEDILACNEKLARHPQLKVFYNFIIGIPTETVAELRATCALMLRLIDENPNAIIGIPNLYRPLPGTELFALAEKVWGYEPPKSLREYSTVEVEGNTSAPWYSCDFRKMCDLMLVACYFVDDKISKMQVGDSLFFKVMGVASKLYKPIARLRLASGYSGFFIEKAMYRVASKMLAGRKQD